MGRPVQPLGTYGKITTRRGSGGGYVARTRYRSLTGDYSRPEASGPTENAARNALKAKIAAGLDRANVGDVTGRSRLSEVAKLWIEEIEEQADLTPQTIQQYRDTVAKIVVPAIGEMRLNELTPGRLDRFLKAEAKVAISRARRARVVLSHVLALAVRHEAMDRNPVGSTASLRRSKKRIVALDLDVLDAIREAIATWRTAEGTPGPRPDGQLGQVIEVMLGSSARIGEVLAIEDPEDIEDDGETVEITISGTVVPIRGVGLVRQPYPKHSREWRTITLPSFAAEAVRDRRAARRDFPPGTTLFSTRKGTLIWPHNLRRQWRSVREATGVDLPEGIDLSDVTPHTFRKTVATTLEGAEEGGIGMAAELLGHHSETVTKEHYVQPRKRVNPQTAAILERLAPGSTGVDPASI